MVFDAVGLESLLSPRPIRYFEEVGSTNDLARAWMRDGAVLGSAVIANAQTQGRGRGGHGWLTPPGTALAVSVVLKPEVEYLARLSMLGALAVVDLLRHVGADDVVIKWPNDVLLQGRKVSGVLPEAEWDGDHLLGAVLGIGVNVRVDFQKTALAGQAISLEDVTETRLDRRVLLKYLLDRVDYWFGRLETAQFFQTWQDELVTLGQIVEIGEKVGVAEAVDEQGALLLRDEQGTLRRVVARDLEAGIL